MSQLDIQALLAKQTRMVEAKAEAVKLKKDSAYHAKQAERKATLAAEAEKEAATLEAELAAISGKPVEEAPAAPAKKK